jgi:phenylalanine-4-hydroxylase
MTPDRFKALENIPEHLLPFIATQDPSRYTAMDHAAWRFILRVSMSYFARHAHPKYLRGLEETGISTDRIPLVSEMDDKLRRFGWRAVPVSGFIPPAVFMEFQSLGVLPIACEMRTLDHLAYTPAPDIVHEAAGHAPIIADPEYAAYLRAYGEVSRKAIFSSQDMAVFEAIRDLSDIKEDPRSSEADITAAQKRLDDAVTACTYVSEAAYLARMNWWTVEYGLVGRPDEPKIYGAGLLSSVGESYNCLKGEVRKIPFTLDCVNTSYDITRPQPQLFVTPDFHTLTTVLEDFSSRMAFRTGGTEALAKAKMAATVTTSVLDSGLQVAGVLEDFRIDVDGRPFFLKFSGKCQLSHGDRELPAQGPARHPEGFSSPVGLLKGPRKSPSLLEPHDLHHLGFLKGKKGRLEFESGIVLEGFLEAELRRDGKLLVLTLGDCSMRLGDEVLYRPEWGSFDLACGETVTSVFGGPADRGSYVRAVGQDKAPKKMQKCNLTDENRALNELYARVRELRDTGKDGKALLDGLTAIWNELGRIAADDWLLVLELVELDHDRALGAPWRRDAEERLKTIAATRTDRRDMIQRGLELLR